MSRRPAPDVPLAWFHDVSGPYWTGEPGKNPLTFAAAAAAAEATEESRDVMPLASDEIMFAPAL